MTSDANSLIPVTSAERQRRRRARLPRRIDYYPSEEALARIEAMQQEQYQKAGGIWNVSTTLSAVINLMIISSPE
ncbi:hypothetical protein ACKF11_08730 [Methylobacillus sp. Pita2]|uniref:hypothetical protein n=1 Tax=Methylobacillus sp. Pita2 TaxID=3383245 RepID=UPI0038B6227E